MFLSNTSINRPVFTVMVTVALMTLGLVAVKNIGVDLFPDISIPIVTVRTIYPGAGPQEVEQQVTKHIEEAVSSVNGVDEVRSTSQDSASIIIIQFKLSADVKAAASDVREKLAGIRGELPKDIKDPIIERVDLTSAPIMTYVVSSSRDPAETRRIAEDVVKPKLEAIDGVARVSPAGGLEREVHIFVDRQRLDSLGIGLSQVAQQLTAEGFDLPAGHITAGASELSVKTEGRYRSMADIENVIVASLASGAQVKLKDVATIEDGYKEVRTIARYDGKAAVTLEIQKQAGSNTVAVADHIEAAVADMQSALPPDVKLKKAVDSSVYIRRNIHDVTHDIVFGGLMAILVIFLFMLDWRSTLISALSLPTSVITTFFVMWYMGFTFNMMSLLALSLSIGLLIDDAVVVRENIFRHMERGKDPVTAAKDATSEIGLAVMATTFTIVAVFVPVAFMDGIIGRFFKQFGLTVAAAVLVSLFVSFTLDPMMSAHVMKAVTPGHHEEQKRHPVFGPIVRAYERLDSFYRSVLRWALSNRKTVLAVALGLFVGTLFLTKYMGTEFVSPADRGEFLVTLEMPAGVSVAETDRVTAEAEAAIHRSSPEVTSLYTVVGPDEATNTARIRVYCTGSEKRVPVTQWDIQASIRRELTKIPNVKFAVTDFGMVEGPVQHPIEFYVRGDDFDKLQDLAQQAVAVVKAARGTADVDQSFRAGKPESDVQIDRAKAADLGVSVGAIAQTLRLAIEGDVIAKYRANDRDYDVRLRLAEGDRKTVGSLEELTVPATGRRMGGAMAMMGAPKLVDLRQVAHVVTETGPATINRENRQRQIIITANLGKNGKLGDIDTEIQAGLDRILKTAPPGYTFTWGGQSKDMRETFANMGLAMGLAVLFIFFVLASQFESIIHPFTIMVALPLAIVGAFLLMFLTGAAIGMSSMIGVILLLGLVTKNAILLVDYTNELRGQGLSMIDALLEAGPTRLRPILMTSAAMVLGMLPGALARGEGSEFKSPMATAVIGGVIASTLLTLVVVPVVYTWLDRFTSRGRHERAGTGAPGHEPHASVHLVPAAAMAGGPVAASESYAIGEVGDLPLLQDGLVEKA